MRKRSLFLILVPLLVAACSDDSTTVQPPAPLTPDEQTVANVRSMRDVLEKYASQHGGVYGYWENFLGDRNPDLKSVKNVYTGETEPSSARAAAPGQIGIEWYNNCAGCEGGWPGCNDGDITAIGYRITGYGKDHMLITLESVDNVPAEERYLHDVTVANAYLVFDAAKRFAATNNGVFSNATCCDENPDGKYLIQLLPNGTLVTNPFTGAETEPQDGNMLIIPGAIGYLGLDDTGLGAIDGFQLEAYDCNGEPIVTLSPYTEDEVPVRTGCDYLRACLEQFKTDSGHYPHNLDVETTPAGKTVMNIYTAITGDNAPDFLNPYTNEHYIPSIGVATGKGAIAYQPIETSGVVTDYVITGRDVFNEIVRLAPMPLP